jgi:hypothetical protein
MLMEMLWELVVGTLVKKLLPITIAVELLEIDYGREQMAWDLRIVAFPLMRMTVTEF